GLAVRHHRPHRRAPQRAGAAAGVRHDDRAGFAQGVRLRPGRRLERSAVQEGGLDELDDVATASPLAANRPAAAERDKGFDVFRELERAEWDTLMFFYGVILTVGALGTLGYLGLASTAVYGRLGPTWANGLVGVASALIDNIPIMFAVLNMRPEMSQGHWLLVTLTAGVGGSLLSVGSAAGVALMGQARGTYTFRRHLRWTWAVALGYLASIGTHLLVNRRYF